jgi:hypothetical protein
MTSVGPWNLKGLRPETVASAREAARRSGMSVGEWLNGLIRGRNDFRQAVMQPAEYEDQAEYGWHDEAILDARPSRQIRKQSPDCACAHDSALAREAALTREKFGEIYIADHLWVEKP